jgi:hypothetical protein
MVMAGVPLEAVQKLGGWKTFSMVLRYAHLSPSYQKEWVKYFGSRMDTIWTHGGKEGKGQDALKPDKSKSHLSDLNG